MLLARDGHTVTVLERDPAPNPEDPAARGTRWDRKGVPQFHQPHNLFSRFRVDPRRRDARTGRHAPRGRVHLDQPDRARSRPSSRIRDLDPGDDRFPFVTGRRPVIEAALGESGRRPRRRRRSARRRRRRVADRRTGHRRRTACHRRAHDGRRRAARRSRARRDRPAHQARRVARRDRRPRSRTRSRERVGVRLQHAVLHGPGTPAVDRPHRSCPWAVSRSSFSSATTTRGRSRCGPRRLTLRSDRSAIAIGSRRSCRPARCTRTGWPANRSATCCRWPASSTATGASSSTTYRSRPVLRRSVTRGRARIHRPAGA